MRAASMTLSACLIACLAISGCSTTPNSPSSVASRALNKPVAEQSRIRTALLDQYNEWRGTPYRLGGLTRGGVDCSGFVHLTFQQRLGLAIPRTTKHLAKVGHPVTPHQLNAGDLVFFNTGFKTRHVGIYVGNGAFLHASTSSGVTVSSLESDYWRERFTHARRILSN